MPGLIERAREVRQYTEMAAQLLPDDQIGKASALLPKWEDLVKAGETVAENFRFVYAGQVFKTAQPDHKFSGTYIPGADGTESLFTKYNEVNAGTREDPIPYDGNMELFEGKYYCQGDKVFYCHRSTGQAVFHALLALIGLYVIAVD